MGKTREEINGLKQNWQSDPCWDIETTKGFESNKEELLTFRLAKEAEWEAQARARVMEKAFELGIEDMPKLAEYIIHLEYRIRRLSKELEELQNRWE